MKLLRRLLPACLLLLVLGGCGGGDPENEEPVLVTVPRGAGSAAIADSLAAHGVIRQPFLFRVYTRIRGVDRRFRPGVYRLERRMAWGEVVDRMISGDVERTQMVVPEGWAIAQIAPRLAAITGVDADSLANALLDSAAAEQYGVPGPNLEGYLYPATYTFPLGSDLDAVLRMMVNRYRRVWTEDRRARADSIGMSEQEVVTLASIVEREARVWTERDTIAAVYRNRLDIGMRLQADPTVQYALGEWQSRLLFAHIDEVADNPYNTYRHSGLPPGPIGAPSAAAIDAVLDPADVDYLYFVARPGGRHIFTRTNAEHNRARVQVRREAERLREEREGR
jgi:UPF0755 protein